MERVLLEFLSVSNLSSRCQRQAANSNCLALLSQLFAPTSFRVTFESEGPGAFTNEQVEEMVVRDANGRVTELRLPNKLVIVANHQASTVCLKLIRSS